LTSFRTDPSVSSSVFASGIFFADGPFFGGGMPPAVAPEGDLVFWGKPSCPLTFINLLTYTSRLPTGVLGM
jgi:hypothetical protein